MVENGINLFKDERRHLYPTFTRSETEETYFLMLARLKTFPRAALWGPRQKYFGGVSLRPRKLDENLTRHGRRARRVAFLRPRGVFGEYCSPLDYVSARIKVFSKGRKVSPA